MLSIYFFYSIQEQSLLLTFPTWRSIMKMAMTFWIPNMKLRNWKIYRKFGKTLQEILLCFILPVGLSCLQIVWININQIKLIVKCLKSWPQPLLWSSLRKHLFLLALRRQGRFARRNVCDSAAEIPH